MVLGMGTPRARRSRPMPPSSRAGRFSGNSSWGISFMSFVRCACRIGPGIYSTLVNKAATNIEKKLMPLTGYPERGHLPDMPENEAQAGPMAVAFAEAEAAGVRDEVPVGAVLVDGATGAILAQSGNRVEELHDP